MIIDSWIYIYIYIVAKRVVMNFNGTSTGTPSLHR